MQIGSSTASALPVVYRRDQFADPARAPQRQPEPETPAAQPTQGEITRIRSRAAAQRSDEQTEERLQNLPPRSRSALQSYLDNGPTIQERLGVELAGLDVFA